MAAVFERVEESKRFKVSLPLEALPIRIIPGSNTAVTTQCTGVHAEVFAHYGLDDRTKQWKEIFATTLTVEDVEVPVTFSIAFPFHFSVQFAWPKNISSTASPSHLPDLFEFDLE